jgi:hypothetical protein
VKDGYSDRICNTQWEYDKLVQKLGRRNLLGKVYLVRTRSRWNDTKGIVYTIRVFWRGFKWYNLWFSNRVM